MSVTISDVNSFNKLNGFCNFRRVEHSHGRKSGGGGGTGGRFSGGGTQYQMSPPHVLGVGWILVDMYFFCLFFYSFFGLFPFFFFFACQKCSWCGLGTPTHFDLCDFRRRWRSGKKCRSPPPPPPPPPRSSAGLALPWGWRAVGKNVSVVPPTIRFGFAPLNIAIPPPKIVLTQPWKQREKCQDRCEGVKRWMIKQQQHLNIHQKQNSPKSRFTDQKNYSCDFWKVTILPLMCAHSCMTRQINLIFTQTEVS